MAALDCADRCNTASPAPPATQRIITLYEQLSPAQLPHLAEYYAADAHFKDPFNDVYGVAAITQIFTHMFATLDQPRFCVLSHISQGDQAFLSWEFRFAMRRWRRGQAQCIRGATLLRFDQQGRVSDHRDYWDAAEELYEKLPVLGALMRWLRQSAAVPAATDPSSKNLR